LKDTKELPRNPREATSKFAFATTRRFAQLTYWTFVREL